MLTAQRPASLATAVPTYQRWIIPGLVLVQLLSKLPWLDRYPLAIDEQFSVYYAQYPAWDGMMTLRYERHPPLYILLLHYWMALFGISALSVRMLSLVFSTLAVLMLNRFAGRVFGWKIGLTAALLFILSNMQMHYAQETRVYALLVFAAIWSLDGFVDVVESARRGEVSGRTLARWVVPAALTPYLHYFGTELVLLQLAACWLMPGLPDSLQRVSIRGAFWMAVGFLPLSYFFLYNMKYNLTHKTSWLTAPQTAQELMAPLVDVANSTAVGLGMLVLIVGVYGYSIRRGRTPSWVEWFLLAVFPGVWLGKLAVSYLAMPMYLDRFLMHTTPACYVLTALSLQRLAAELRLRAEPLLAGALLAVGLGYTPVYDRHWDMQYVAETLRREQTPGTIVYFYPDHFEINALYYFQPEAFRLVPREAMRKAAAARNFFPLKYPTDLDPQRIRNASKVILVDAQNEEREPNWPVPDRIRHLRPNDRLNYEEKGLVRIYTYAP